MNGLIRVSYFNDTATVTKWVISKNRMINHLRSCAVIAHLFQSNHIVLASVKTPLIKNLRTGKNSRVFFISSTMHHHPLRLKNHVVASFIPHGSTANSASNSSSSSMSDDTSEYIFDLVCSPYQQQCIIASVSDHSLLTVDSNYFAITSKGKGHRGRINSIECCMDSTNLLLSASNDKNVFLWDLRVFTGPVSKIPHDDEVLGVSSGMNGVLASSCNSSIFFYDMRFLTHNHSLSTATTTTGSCSGGSSKRPRQTIAEYSDVHSDVITHLKFHPVHRNILHSASEDGLICTYDVTVSESEDAVTSILNTECPIARFGFFGANLEGVYSISTVETMSCWHYPSAQRLSCFSTIREEFNLDYLVDCFTINHDYDNNCSELYLLGGNSDGMGSIIKVDPTACTLVNTINHQEYGHGANIRCCSIQYNGNETCLVTGGEDSRICRWVVGEEGGGNPDMNQATLHSGTLKAKTADLSRNSLHHRPY